MHLILSGNSYTVLQAQESLSIFETAYFPSLVNSTISTDTSNPGLYSNYRQRTTFTQELGSKIIIEK
jgi:hypothetical protein